MFEDPTWLRLLVISKNAFGVEGLNHVLAWSTKYQLAAEMDGSSKSIRKSEKYTNEMLEKYPSREVELPEGMSELEAITKLRAWKGWNKGPYIVGVNDCHTQLEAAFKAVGIKYPGAPEGGRIDNVKSPKPGESLTGTSSKDKRKKKNKVIKKKPKKDP